ncbi:uncharacterized, partial [Tachysurus ichikawai]
DEAEHERDKVRIPPSLNDVLINARCTGSGAR